MIWINGSVVCLLSVLWTLVRGDAEVSCVFMESCILPCSFHVDTEAVIHWIQVKTGVPRVHSYFLNQDQLAQQDQRFRGRTSLFKDQISRGNASLQLTGVELQDQSKYMCITSTTRGNKESMINLKVDTSVSGSSSETTILCTTSNTSRTGLIWRFNYSQMILNQTRANIPYTVSEEWRQQVKSVSESGSLTLQHLSSNQDGIYTCELSDDEETYVTITLLMIEEGATGVIVGVVVGVVVVGVVMVGVVVVLIAGLVFYCISKKILRIPHVEPDVTQRRQSQSVEATNVSP